MVGPGFYFPYLMPEGNTYPVNSAVADLQTVHTAAAQPSKNLASPSVLLKPAKSWLALAIVLATPYSILARP